MSLISDSGFPMGASSRSLFMVTNPNTTAPGFRFAFAYGNSSGAGAYFFGQNGSSCYYGGYGVDVIVPSCLTATEWNFFSGTYDGTTAEYRRNGLLEVPLARAWNTVPNNAYIGRQVNNNEYWSGSIKEILLFSEELSQDLIESVEGHLACKHGLRDLLDVTHPFHDLVGANQTGCP